MRALQLSLYVSVQRSAEVRIPRSRLSDQSAQVSPHRESSFSSNVRADDILCTNLEPHRSRYHSPSPPPPSSLPNRLIERAHISQPNEQQVDNLDKRSFTARARLLRQVVLGVYRVLSLSLLALVFLGAHFIAHGLSRQLGPNLFEVSAGCLHGSRVGAGWEWSEVDWGGVGWGVVLCCAVFMCNAVLFL